MTLDTSPVFDDDAYGEGVRAYELGQDRASCPYCPETASIKYIWWGIGWDDTMILTLRDEELSP